MEADPPRSSELIETTVARLHEALAILEAIDAAEMLSSLPADPTARRAHQQAVSMLAVLRRDLGELRKELQAASAAQDAIHRAVTCTRARPKAQP
jgi:hypothetical protein